jgi:hypothetical protein
METVAGLIADLTASSTKSANATIKAFDGGSLILAVRHPELGEIEGVKGPTTTKIPITPEVIEALAASNQCHQGLIERLVVPEEIDELADGVIKFHRQGKTRSTRYAGRAIGSAPEETETPDQFCLWAIAPWEGRIYYVFDVVYAFNHLPMQRDPKARDAFLERYDLDIDFYDWLL